MEQENSVNPYSAPRAAPLSPGGSGRVGLRVAAGIGSGLMLLLILATGLLGLISRLGASAGGADRVFMLLGGLIAIPLFCLPYYRGLQAAFRPSAPVLVRVIRSNIMVSLLWLLVAGLSALSPQPPGSGLLLGLVMVMVPSVLNIAVGLKVRPAAPADDGAATGS
ncbi:MAG: hypothetical protein K0S46_910 [Moraxellaceae bacterium]|jgi:hypothetical protein|nr:hypothetical protein [Moraxellaceae bacterium]